MSEAGPRLNYLGGTTQTQTGRNNTLPGGKGTNVGSFSTSPSGNYLGGGGHQLSRDPVGAPGSTNRLDGPGHYPQDIPDRVENPYGKKVTFQTDLTTQNLKTWDLCQKMNIQPESVVKHGYHGDGKSHGRSGTGGRPRSQDEDDNTTTSGSYTINPDNDFDDGLPSSLSIA